MAESEYIIKVRTDTDASSLQDIQEALEALKAYAEEAGTELSDSLDEANTRAEDTANSLDTASESAEQLGNSIEEVSGSNLDDVASGADELAGSLDKASESVENFNNGMGVMEGSMMLSASEQIRGIGTSTESMSQSLDEAQIHIGQLATETGMAEGEMTGLINNISNVTFPRDEAIAYVQALHQMGVANEDLGNSATSMDRINDATHMGYGNVIQLTQGLRSMGIEADNLPSSFNAIAYAQSNINGGAQTLGTVLKRQAGTINEYGLTVDQVAVIMNKLSEKGVQGMKMGSELSNVLKENNGDIQAIEQSLGLEAGALENATDKTGEYEGELVNLANQEMEHKTITERLGAVWEDFSLTLAPIISPLGSVIGLLGQVGSFAMGINGIITLAETFGILNKATLATIPSQIAEGTAGWFSIGWALVAVAIILAVIAVLVYLYYTNEDVRNAINQIGQVLMQVGQIVYAYFMSALQGLIDILYQVWNAVNIVIQGLINAVNSGNGNILQSIANVLVYLSQLPMRLGVIFINMIAKALGFGDNFIQTFQQSATNAVNGFINSISRAPSELASELQNMITQCTTFAGNIGSILWEAGVNAVTGFLGGLGRNSPGIIQKEMVAEITETGERIPRASKNLLSNVGRLGSDIVGEFGNPSLELSSNGALLSSNNKEAIGNNYEININIDNVDSEDRVEEIVEAVRKALAWNNTTAGRVV